MRDFAIVARAGWTFLTYASRVSQLGRSEGFQFLMASLRARCVSDRFLRASGCWAASRPKSKFSRVTCNAHLLQCDTPRLRLSPQPRQRRSTLGTSIRGNEGRPFASLRCCCVKGVCKCSNPERELSSQSLRAMYSTHTETSLPQVGPVSLSFAQR